MGRRELGLEVVLAELLRVEGAGDEASDGVLRVDTIACYLVYPYLSDSLACEAEGSARLGIGHLLALLVDREDIPGAYPLARSPC